MSVADPGLRRVSIHAGGAVADVALPSQLPVTTLIPPIVDLMEGRPTDSPDATVARRYQLSRPGTAPLQTSMTLLQNNIRDGDILILSHSRATLPAPRYDDVAEAVSAALDSRAAGRPHVGHATRLSGALAAAWLTGIGGLALIRNSSGATANTAAAAGIAGLTGVVALIFAAYVYRTGRDQLAGLTLGLIATAFASLSGFLAVPGGLGAANVLLAAMTAAATSVLTMRVSGCGGVAFTAVACFALIVAGGALVGVLTTVPPRAIGSVTALVSIGLLGAAARLSVIVAGLSPRLPAISNLDATDSLVDDLSTKAIRAYAWSTSLLAAFCSAAAVGSIVTVLTGTPQFDSVGFAVVTGILLLLRANPVERRTMMCVVGGIVTIGMTLAVAALRSPHHQPWIAAGTAALVALAMFLGFVAPAISLSPVVRKSIELTECLMLIAMVPLTCWVCGLYGAVRTLYPTWG